MSKVIIGIDPGCSGAIVVLNSVGTYQNAILTPTVKVGAKTRVNGAAVASFLRAFDLTGAEAFLEQVGAMPG